MITGKCEEVFSMWHESVQAKEETRNGKFKKFTEKLKCELEIERWWGVSQANFPSYIAVRSLNTNI